MCYRRIENGVFAINLVFFTPSRSPCVLFMIMLLCVNLIYLKKYLSSKAWSHDCVDSLAEQAELVRMLSCTLCHC